LNTIIQRLHNLRFIVPTARLAGKYFDADEDVWVSEPIDVPPGRLGSPHDFWHYLDGTSSVRVENVEQIAAWLSDCEYVSDQKLFSEPDYWQHPLTLEQLRRGDCEDFSLWAWRKLGELGLAARFFVGRWQWDPDRPRFHAWVVFDDQEGMWLFEGTNRDAAMKRPFDVAKHEYRPHFSVGHMRDARAYGGWIEYELWLRTNKDKVGGQEVAVD
jgi:hypothetical protein